MQISCSYLKKILCHCCLQLYTSHDLKKERHLSSQPSYLTIKTSAYKHETALHLFPCQVIRSFAQSVSRGAGSDAPAAGKHTQMVTVSLAQHSSAGGHVVFHVIGGGRGRGCGLQLIARLRPQRRVIHQNLAESGTQQFSYYLPISGNETSWNLKFMLDCTSFVIKTHCTQVF